LIQVNVYRHRRGQKRLMDIDRPEQTPDCPSCGRPMRLARAVAKNGAQPELSIYECKVCGVMLTAVREPTRTTESA
jgi:ribosomal protein L37AE/L43A